MRRLQQEKTSPQFSKTKTERENGPQERSQSTNTKNAKKNKVLKNKRPVDITKKIQDYSFKDYTKVHGNGELFECTLCERFYADDTSLEVHFKSSHRKLWYTCPKCGEHFETDLQMKMHVCGHLKPSYPCSVCKKTFLSASTLRFHEKKHSKVVLFVCKLCNRSYFLRSSLVRHKKMYSHVSKEQQRIEKIAPTSAESDESIDSDSSSLLEDTDKYEVAVEKQQKTIEKVPSRESSAECKGTDTSLVSEDIAKCDNAGKKQQTTENNELGSTQSFDETMDSDTSPIQADTNRYGISTEESGTQPSYTDDETSENKYDVATDGSGTSKFSTDDESPDDRGATDGFGTPTYATDDEGHENSSPEMDHANGISFDSVVSLTNQCLNRPSWVTNSYVSGTDSATRVVESNQTTEGLVEVSTNCVPKMTADISEDNESYDDIGTELKDSCKRGPIYYATALRSLEEDYNHFATYAANEFPTDITKTVSFVPAFESSPVDDSIQSPSNYDWDTGFVENDCPDGSFILPSSEDCCVIFCEDLNSDGLKNRSKASLLKTKNYSCPVCEKAFSLFGDLKRHIRKHKQQKPHRCTVCGKFFTRELHLQEHVTKHTAWFPDNLNCSYCHKVFSTPGDLTCHSRIHRM